MRGPTPLELEARGSREGGHRATQCKWGQSAKPLLTLRAIGNIAINLPHLPSTPSTPASPGAWVRRSEAPVTGWPLLPSLEPNFQRGPKEGCSGERGSAEVVRGGGGAPSPGIGGKRERLGEVPERTAPGREERPPPTPQRSKSSSPSSRLRSPRASTTPQCPRKKPRVTPPQTERSTGGESGAALTRGEG